MVCNLSSDVNELFIFNGAFFFKLLFVLYKGTSLWLCTGFSRLLRNGGLTSHLMGKLCKIAVRMRSNNVQ